MARFLHCALFDVPCLLMDVESEEEVDGGDAIDSHYAPRQVPTFFFHYITFALVCWSHKYLIGWSQ